MCEALIQPIWEITLRAVLLSFFTFVVGMHIAYADYMQYDSSYKSLKVGSSTLQSLKHHHGTPLKTVEKKNFTLYRYRDFDAAVNKSDGKIRSIIIFDRRFKDRNYLQVGDRKRSVESVLRMKIDDNVAVDRVNGIVYWFKDDRIQKIVLAHQLKR